MSPCWPPLTLQPLPPAANERVTPEAIHPPVSEQVMDEFARAVIHHWWREPIAGIAAIAIGCWDTWHFGRDAGLTSSLDELLVVGGIVLIAGSRQLFLGEKSQGTRDLFLGGKKDERPTNGADASVHGSV